jgi:hypothetical protein
MGARSFHQPQNPDQGFATASAGAGGPRFVWPTADFNAGAAPARLVDFRIHVDNAGDGPRSIDGPVAGLLFTLPTVGDDGPTLSIRRYETALISVLYKPDAHRLQMDRYHSEQTADRASITRLRTLEVR